MKMPKEKEQTPKQSPIFLACPACGSEISSDGKTLRNRSHKLTRLEENAKLLPELSKEFDRVEKELKETSEELASLKSKGKKANVESEVRQEGKRRQADEELA